METREVPMSLLYVTGYPMFKLLVNSLYNC